MADVKVTHLMSKMIDKDIPFEFVAPRLTSSGPIGAISHEVLTGTVQVLDFCAVFFAGAAAFASYVVAVRGQGDELAGYVLTIFVVALAFVSALRRTGAYSLQRLPQLGWQIGRVTLVWAGALATLATLAFFAKVGDSYSRIWAATWAALTLGELAVMRVGLRGLVQRWTRQGRLSRTVAVVGAGESGEQLVRKLLTAEHGRVAIAGIFDDRLGRVPDYVAGCPILGTTDDLITFARRVLIDEIIIALPLRAEGRIGDLVAKLRSLPVDLRLSIDQIGAFPMRGIAHTESGRMIEILDRPLKHWSGILKWLEDQILGTICFIAFAPLMALIALMVRLDSPGPALFIQERFGYNNRIVRVYKFRTMRVEQGDPSGAARTVPNDPRLTRVGRYLRRYSLDELPQLLNVLRGDMSLVGPRPHALAMKAGERLYHHAVSDYFLRHRVRPGMTGWAQVNGLRGEIDTLEKARQRVIHDLYYIDHWSLWFDLKILMKTLVTVFRVTGAG
jgi:Undecaprenyl-phosphate glucose phosphotransferase